MNELLRRILNLPPQASTVARDLDYLHYFVIGTTMGGALLVSALAGYFLLRYRKTTRLGEPAPPDERHHHTRGGTPAWVEVVIVGGLLSLFCLWWVVGFRQYVRLQVAPKDAITVYVTAKKWMWSFAHPDGRSSNSILYVPKGRPIKLAMTSRDVIHSFYVPAFRIKQDVIPGRTTTTWFEATKLGAYPILCAEYCGTGHSTMRGQVVVLSPNDYQRHIDRRMQREVAGLEGESGQIGTGDSGPASLATIGERVAAERGCLRCHTLDGTPHIGPTWAGLFGSTIELEDGHHVTVDEAFITESMMDPMADVHRGFPAVMPSYQGLITAPETGAIVELIKALRTSSASSPSDPLPSGDPLVELPHPPSSAEPEGSARPGNMPEPAASAKAETTNGDDEETP